LSKQGELEVSFSDFPEKNLAKLDLSPGNLARIMVHQKAVFIEKWQSNLPCPVRDLELWP
jgi:hypothetical protein